MQKFFLAAALVPSLILCVITPVLAANKQENIQENKVVVTASRMTETARTVPQSVTIIDNEILDKNQYENLASLLENYGFQIMSYGPNQASAQITMRGVESSYVNPLDSNILLLVNGAPIASANLDMIPLNGIERIEILRGPGAVQYGSAALGGVINVIPKKGGEKFVASAEAGGGTWNAYRALGSLSGSKGIIDFAGAVSWNKQGDDYTTGNDKLYRDTKAESRMHYLLNAGINFNKENRVSIILLGTSDKNLGLNNDMTTEQKYASGLDRKLNQINSSLNAAYEGGYKETGLSWKLRYFNAYNQYNARYDKNNEANLFMKDYNIYTKQAGSQGQLSWNWNFLTLTGGIDYTASEYISGFEPAYEQENTAEFGLLKLAFFDEKIVLTGGIRQDVYKFKVKNSQRSLNNTSLSSGIALNPWNWLTLRASLGESFKVPSGLAILGYSAGINEVIGNPDLKPEKGLGWDTGFDIHYSGLKMGLTFFSTEYHDKIIIDKKSLKTRYVNEDGKSFFNGLEGNISLDLGEFFDWNFTLAPYFNFTKLFNFNDAEGDRIYNVRDFTGSAGINFNYLEWGTNLDFRLNYLGYQKEQIWNGFIREKDKRTGGKTTIDIFASQTVYEWKDGGKLALKGEIRNLANEKYAYRYDYPMPGRSFYIGLRYDFN